MHDSQSELDKITRTLVNLNALKEGASSPGEAAAAAEAISRLCLKHNLDMASIGNKSEAQIAGEKCINTKWSFDGDVVYDQSQTWKLALTKVIARHNFCTTIEHYRDVYNVVIIGKTYNIEIVKSLTEYIREQIRKLAIKYWRLEHPEDYGSLNNTKTSSTWRRSFRYSIINAIDTRLERQKREQIREAGSKGSDLVVQVALELDEAIDEYYGISKEDRARLNATRDAERTRRANLTPEELAIETAKRIEEMKKFKPHKQRGRKRSYDVDYNAIDAGKQAAEEINLDKQIASANNIALE